MFNELKELKQLKQEEKELKHRIKALQSEIENYMNENGLQEYENAGIKCTYRTVKSERFKSKEFKEKHKHLYDKFVQVLEYKRFTIN